MPVLKNRGDSFDRIASSKNAGLNHRYNVKGFDSEYKNYYQKSLHIINYFDNACCSRKFLTLSGERYVCLPICQLKLLKVNADESV